MRLATAKIKGRSEFVLALPQKDWCLWSDYAAQFPQDKTLQETRSLLDYVKRFSVLDAQVRKNISALEKLPTHKIDEKDFLLPFTPVMFRDFYCFEEHVKNARKGRGLDMIPEWYEAPIFYYSNHLSFRGPFEDLPYPQDCQELDLELELAAVVGKELRNATVEEARAAIVGYSLVNDWTARDFQRFEMKVNMGPTKGKDFATTFGSFIVTPDEIASFKDKKGFNIEVEALINGESLTKRNWNQLQFSFEEMLVRASKNCTVYPGEVIASGTIGGGCLMEHNVLAKLARPEASNRWLKKGDVVTLRWLPQGPTMTNKIGDSQ